MRKSCTELTVTSLVTSRLADQPSYQLVHAGTTDEQDVRASQLPRFKQPAFAGMCTSFLSFACPLSRARSGRESNFRRFLKSLPRVRIES